MSNTIRIKRGKSNNLSVSNLQDGELALTLDTNKLYTNKGQISSDNVYVGDIEPADSNIKCWISPSGKIDLSSLWDQIYPVGSIYLSVNATNPSVLFGGTWEQLQDRFLLACSSTYRAGSTGGEATHTLTVDEMPSHYHQMKDGGRMVYWDSGLTPVGATYGSSSVNYQATWNSYTLNEGGNESHNNMPPYLAVYMWKRIS